MQRRTYSHRTARHPRNGSTALMAAFALLVMMMCVALVLDRLWMEAVMVELTTGAEAAALAAGREIASDDLLRDNPNPVESVERARQKAAEIALQNTVAGTPLELNTQSENGDIRFGRRLFDEELGRSIFLETDYATTTVHVHAERSRSRWNPVALFMHGLGSTHVADAVEEAEATWSNEVVGLRPYEGVPVPALPLAIWKNDRFGRRKDTWKKQIDERQGTDAFGYDAVRREVTQEPDGIREIVLRSMPPQGKATDGNIVVVDVGTELTHEAVEAQFRDGWKVEHLKFLDGAMRFGRQAPRLNAAAVLDDSIARQLAPLVGQPRIVLLYEEMKPDGPSGKGNVLTVEAVAGRVMAVRFHQGACEIVFQPSVITTRTALLKSDLNDQAAPDGGDADFSTDESVLENEAIPPNRYIYKLQLTH